MRRSMLLRFLCCLLLLAPLAAQAQPFAWDDGTVPYVTTPTEVVERMMILGDIKAGDRVIDLGSGDGRIVIAAAKRGASGLGVDLDPSLVKLATERAKAAGVSKLASFKAMDLYDTDLSPASVVTMYLLPEFNAKLLPRLLRLKPGTRIVSHDGGIGDWPPDERLEMRAPEKPVGVGGLSRVELWIVPADVRGAWISQIPDHGGRWLFRIQQKDQEMDIDVSTQGKDLLVRNSRLRGEDLLHGRRAALRAHHAFDMEGDSRPAFRAVAGRPAAAAYSTHEKENQRDQSPHGTSLQLLAN